MSFFQNPAAEKVERARELGESGRLPEAEQAFRSLLQLQPLPAGVHLGLGRVLALQGRCADATPVLRRALDLCPDDAQCHVELAQALRGQGLNDEAQSHFDRAQSLQPGNRTYALLALLHRGTTLDGLGRVDDALACFEQAVADHPASVDAWAALGVVQAFRREPEVAVHSLQRALQLDPGRIDLIERFGSVLQDMGKLEDAAIVFERALKLAPERPLNPGRLMHCKMLMAEWTAIERLQRGIEAGITQGVHTTEPFGLQGYCADPALLLQAAQLHAQKRFPPGLIKLAPAPRRAAGARIRIGYVGGEFRKQATSILLTRVLELHQRSRFEVFVFDNGWDDGSEWRRRIEAATQIVPIRGISDVDACRRVREREIDLLVNLNGYFGLERNHIFASRAAPVQVNYLGFPGTMGASWMDYIVADRSVIPEADRRYYTEQVAYLPDSYQANDDQRRVAAEPRRRSDIGLPEDAFVFCCMNNVYKIMPPVFDVWMRLLQQVPGSVLLLYSELPEAMANLRHEAGQRGVAPERLHFAASWHPENHLARLRLADLFLDTLPYNAHTTASDALWAGLPVLSCVGPAFAGRVGSSLLQAVGLDELVTTSLADYEALALALARAPARLAALRARLAARLAQAPLFDSARYTRHLDWAWEHMVERQRLGLAPASFTVPALPA